MIYSEPLGMVLSNKTTLYGRQAANSLLEWVIHMNYIYMNRGLILIDAEDSECITRVYGG